MSVVVYGTKKIVVLLFVSALILFFAGCGIEPADFGQSASYLVYEGAAQSPPAGQEQYGYVDYYPSTYDEERPIEYEMHEDGTHVRHFRKNDGTI